jgi:glycosyltransferase involved in cell wall biosynthesis
LKIAVNTRFLLKDKLEGIGTFTFEVLQRIVKNHPEHEFIFLFDRPYHKQFLFGDNVKPIQLFPPARHPFLWLWWFELAIPKVLKEEKCDLFISTDGFNSLRSQTPSLIVIHDLAYEHTRGGLSYLIYKYLKWFGPRYARKASRIISVSEYSKQDIVKLYKIDPSKIDVVGNAAHGECFYPITLSKIEECRKTYSKGKPYFIFVGALHPRKNILNLLKAFAEFKTKKPNDTKLMIVGRKGWGTKEIFETLESNPFKDDIIFTGRVSNEEYRHLLGAALALTYVPFIEGFGIPILEAQKCDCPVITSNVTSMPEVAGDSAILVDPYSVGSIAEGLSQIAFDQEKRQKLIEKGRLNCERYSWDTSAELFWKSVEKTLA